jgi:cytochrome c oxidase assembly protein subunit 15
MGFHGLIEFGNRLLTFVLIIIAIVMFAFVLRMRKERPELFRMSLGLGLGIPGQAVIGGVTVLTNLNPYVVGLHYFLSAVLVAVAAVLVYRVRRGPQQSGWGVAPPVRLMGGALLAVLGISVVLGILTTGSGPHAGDAGAARNGLDSWLLQHFHAWPSYIVLGLVVTLSALAWFAGVGSPGYRRAITGSLAVTVGQILVGLFQANNGLPVLAVGVHMVLAAVLVAFVVTALLTQRELVTEAAVDQSLQRGTVASSS